MLLDIARFVFTPCPKHVRAMGYLSEQIAIKNRFDRVKDAWKPHCDRTKHLILDAARLCPQRRKAVLFGSGMLLDIPLDSLCEMFQEVILVDVVHPPFKGFFHRNLTKVAWDVTGTAQAVYHLADHADKELPKSRPERFCDDPEVDLVASVNLLSQLPYIPCTYMVARKNRPDPLITAFGKQLIEAHVEYLTRLPGVVALICDLKRRTLDRNGKLVESLDALYGVQLPWKGEEWLWDLAPAPRSKPRVRLSAIGDGNRQRQAIGKVIPASRRLL